MNSETHRLNQQLFFPTTIYMSIWRLNEVSSCTAEYFNCQNLYIDFTFGTDAVGNRGSSVSIETGLRTGRPGLNSRQGQ
jgi:hypothetical protein